MNPLEGMQLVSMPPTSMSRDALVLKRVFDSGLGRSCSC